MPLREPYDIERPAVRTDPKPLPRIVNPDAKPFDNMPRELGCCPLCGRHVGTDGLTRHHLINKSQGGADLPENLIWVCGHGSKGCHGILTSHWREGKRSYRDVARDLHRYCRVDVPGYGWYTDTVKYEGWLEYHYLGYRKDDE